MSALSLLQAEPMLPVYDDSKNLSLKKLALLMDINHSELAQIVQRNVRTIERSRPSATVLNRLKPLLYALKMLWQLTDGNTTEIQRWLREPLIE